MSSGLSSTIFCASDFFDLSASTAASQRSIASIASVAQAVSPISGVGPNQST
jgi:hypothetical protein